MNTLPETLFTALEAVGTVAFAVSGATVALQRKLDIFGVLLLGLTTALGGGCLRDLLLGKTPPVMFREPLYAIVALMTALVVFLLAWFCRGGFFGHMVLIDRINNVFDALGLGMFSVIGVRAGIAAGYAENVVLCLFLGLRGPAGESAAVFAGVFTVFIIRMLATHYRWSLPRITEDSQTEPRK